MTPVNLPVKMPSPRSKTAPRFNGKNLTEFINEYEIHAKAAMLEKDEKAKLLMSYLSMKIRHTVEDLPEFKAKNWDKMVERLNRLYYSADHRYRPSQTKFRDFVKNTRKFKRRVDLDKYTSKFLLMSNKLVENSQITPAKQDRSFFAACQGGSKLSWSLESRS